MKKYRFISLFVIICIAVGFSAILLRDQNVYADLGISKADVMTEPFACYTYYNDNVINAYKNEDDGKWYLFVPSDTDINDIIICYRGNIAETSGGRLDKSMPIIKNPFSKNGDSVNLSGSDGTVYTVVAMKASLPSVMLYFDNDLTIDALHTDKNVIYGGNTFDISEPSGVYNYSAENSVEIKGRGNSTWDLTDKKGYQLKFDKKISILGMNKSRTWLLIANAFDDSMMRNKLTYNVAQSMDMAFVPSYEYVDLWINGDYRGTYILGEKVELESERLHLTKPDACLFEHDEGFYMQEDTWFLNDYMNRHFILKDSISEDEQDISKAVTDFNETLDNLMKYLYSTQSNLVTLEKLSDFIDVESFAEYYLINEYAVNCESFVSSFYWYKDGADDVIHLGPVWDFDTSYGNDGMSADQMYGYKHPVFIYLLAADEFRSYTADLYNKHKYSFESMSDCTELLKEKIADSAQMNYLRWNILGKESPKVASTYFAQSFEEAVSDLNSWIVQRNKQFFVPQPAVVNSSISADGRTVKLCFEDGQSYDGVNFAVWNTADAQSPVIWYTAVWENGAWRADVDLSLYSTAGLYRADVYAAGYAEAKGTGSCYVEKAAESDYQLSFRLKDTTGVITLDDKTPCTDVVFEMWSTENGFDDLQTMHPYRNAKGQWEYKIDMNLFASSGQFYIRAYKNTIKFYQFLLNIIY